MQMQLDHHLAGLAVGRLEPDRQAAIDLLAGHRIEHGPHHHAARFGQGRIARRMAALEGPRFGQKDQRIRRFGAAQPNDRERARRGP